MLPQCKHVFVRLEQVDAMPARAPQEDEALKIMVQQVCVLTCVPHVLDAMEMIQ